MGAFNGSGTFVRSYSWVTDAANSVNITASRMDTEDNGFAAGLSNCLTKDGQNTATANLPMGGFKITGLANGTNPTDAVAYGQLSGFAALSGATFTGKLVTVASATGAAGFNIPAGTAPTSPVSGDFWASSSALFTYLGGTTYQLATLAGTEILSNKTFVACGLDFNCFISPSGTVSPTGLGYRGVPLAAQSQGSTITLALVNAGQRVANTDGGWTIPANASIAFPVDSVVVLHNNSGSPQTVTINSDTLTWAGTASTGTRTVAANGLATLVKVGSTNWLISGNIT